MPTPSPKVADARSVSRYEKVQPSILQGRSGTACATFGAGNHFECTVTLLDAHGTQRNAKIEDEKGKPLQKITLIYQPLEHGQPAGKEMQLVANRHVANKREPWSGTQDTWDIIKAEGRIAEEASVVTPMLNQMGASFPLGECRIESIHVQRVNEKAVAR